MADNKKAHVVGLLLDGKLSMENALQSLDCNERTIYRMKASFKQEGPVGLIHKLRGREAPNRMKESKIKRILKLHEEVYYDANDTHFCELLLEREGIKIGRSTAQRLLRSHGIPAKRKRRPPKYRTRRPRKEAFGIMLQLDASYHQWFGPFGPWLTLHGAVDDATGHVWAHFEELETTHGYFELMRQVFLSQGLPLSVYRDRHSIFEVVREKLHEEAQRRGDMAETQFGRAMRELGIENLAAYSSQAKGRIEKLWQLFQDRFVVELRLAGIKTKEEAQKFLMEYLKKYNKRYVVDPKFREPVFRKAPAKNITDDVLCHKEFRVVANDHTISYNRRIYQIPRPTGWRTLAKKSVEIWDRSDGTIKIVYQGVIQCAFRNQNQEGIGNMAA
jgi:transposase